MHLRNVVGGDGRFQRVNLALDLRLQFLSCNFLHVGTSLPFVMADTIIDVGLDTPVLMANGLFRLARKLSPGDFVVGSDGRRIRIVGMELATARIYLVTSSEGTEDGGTDGRPNATHQRSRQQVAAAAAAAKGAAHYARS